MIKYISRFLLILLIILMSLIVYLTYFGIETDKFNNLIKSKANNINQYVKLDFKSTKIFLNLKEQKIFVQIKNPKILIKKNNINLSNLDLYLSIKSFFTSDFLLKRTEIYFKENDIKDITKITNIFLPKIINKKLKKVFAKGTIKGNLSILFDQYGNIKKEYSFSGKISNALIYFNKDFKIKNLSTAIKFGKEVENNGFKASVIQGKFLDLDLANSTINLKKVKNINRFQVQLFTYGSLNFSQILKISPLLNIKTDYFSNLDSSVDLKTDISFDINKKFKIKNLLYSVSGNIDSLKFNIKENLALKNFLPELKKEIEIKSVTIKVNKSNLEQTAELNGLIKMSNSYDSFEIKKNYNYNKKNYTISGSLDLKNSKVNFSNFNYIKPSGEEAKITFDFSFILQKIFKIKKVNFLNKKSKISLSNVILNKDFKLLDFKKLEVKTFIKSTKNNDFLITKSKNIVVLGEVFDAQSLLKSLFKKDNVNLFSKKFNSDIKVNFKKTITGTNDDISNLGMIASINGGSYNKLSLKGNFSNNEIIEMSIYKIDNNRRTLQVISDRARPFIKHLNFIEGFEGGKLEYESLILKNKSNSSLKINNFKVSKVPALAKLLTLASLQGIADTLSGDGIRFESFEMKSISENNVMDIEDALAMGPAVSILFDGYVDKGKTVSLRGVLVPATKLNSIIASIPIVGDILVGKKTGEGVVGVSFKMKGPPKNIKTTVNPIKTLTPRFIVRAVEKMKNKKKEETK